MNYIDVTNSCSLIFKCLENAYNYRIIQVIFAYKLTSKQEKKNLECIINLLTDMLGKYADSRISLFGG
jgi:hypothetical protein